MRKWKLLARGWSVLGRKIGLLLFLLVVGAGLVYWQTAQGVNRTWDGGGTDGTCGGAGTANNWSCSANWSGDTAPTASDVAIFDGTSTKNATITSAVNVAGISINSGYTGTITQSGSNTITIGSSNYSQADGTFTGGSGTIDLNGYFTLSGGTFTSTTGTLEVGRNAATSETTFTVSSGTFNHNSGTVKFAPSKTCNDCGTHTYTVDVSTTLTLYNINISATNSGNSAIVVTTGSGDTVIAVNNFTHTDGVVSGAWEVQNNVIIDSTADGGAGTVTMTGTGSKTYTYTAGGAGPHLRVNNGALSVSAQGGTTSLATHLFSLLAGTFTAPTGTFTIGRDSGAVSETIFTISSGTFSHNSGTVKFSPRKSCNDCGSPTFTIDVPTTLTFYSIEINPVNTGNTNMTVAPGTGDTVVAANNFTHTDGILNGTWEVQGNYTVATTADGGSAPITFTGGNAQVYTDQGGDEANGDVTLNKTPGSSVRLASNADWNAGSQDVIITSGELNMGASYNISTTALTVSTDGSLTNNGTGDLTLAGNVSNSGNLRFLGNGTCGGADSISIASSSAGVQRTWSGAGTYLFHDVTVQDQGGSSAITAYSSTSVSGNGGNWTFSGGACPAQPPAVGLSTGKINMQSGKINLR